MSMSVTEITRIINTVPDATLRKALQQLMAAQVADRASDLATVVAKDALLESALRGDISLEILPATVTRVATSEAWTRTVTVRLKNAAGNTHTWCSQAFASKVSIADTSTAGTASIASTTLTLVNGVASIVVSGDAASWEADETNTLTIANLTILGFTVTGGTSAETIVAGE